MSSSRLSVSSKYVSCKCASGEGPSSMSLKRSRYCGICQKAGQARKVRLYSGKCVRIENDRTQNLILFYDRAQYTPSNRIHIMQTFTFLNSHATCILRSCIHKNDHARNITTLPSSMWLLEEQEHVTGRALSYLYQQYIRFASL